MKCSNSVKFSKHTTLLNLMYYGFGTFNVCIPILQTAIFLSYSRVKNWLFLAVSLLWILTAVLMIVALVIITRFLDAETRVVVNFKEVSLHIRAFAIFAVDSIYIMIMELAIFNQTQDFAWAKKMIDATISATVLDSVCGFILMYILLKIYLVVKEKPEKINWRKIVWWHQSQLLCTQTLNQHFEPRNWRDNRKKYYDRSN